MYAATDRDKPIAIIVPAEPALKKLAHDNGIDGHGLGDLVHDKKLNGVVLKELQQAGRDGGLAGIEIIAGVVMSDDEWNPQNVRAHDCPVRLQYAYSTLGYDDRCAEDQSKSHPG